MKKFWSLSTLIGSLMICSLVATGQTTPSIEGTWLGVLDVGGPKVRMAVKVIRTPGGLEAKFHAPDQGATDLEIDSVGQQGPAVKFEAQKYHVVYEGTLNEKGDEITGTFRQGSSSTSITFRRVTEVPRLSRRQDPQGPYPYDQEDVSYENVRDKVKLAGTLSVPRGSAPHPAVILISGSGSQDRNSTVAGHRIFLVLADYLTRNGIAVLRVDDRGVGGSDLGPLSATSEDYAGDVLTGVAYLKTRKEINSKQIGLVGHSEGGMIAPIAATRSRDVAFIVMLAGLGQKGADIVTTQTALMQKAAGVPDSVSRQMVEALRNVHSILAAEDDNNAAERRIRAAIDAQVSAMSQDEATAFASSKARLEALVGVSVTRWYRYFVAFDPGPVLRKVKVPVLALNGENDLQVPYDHNLRLIAAGLRAGGNKDVTVRAFPGLNHLFQTSRTGLPAEYMGLEETISPEVMETISSWIRRRTVTDPDRRGGTHTF